jgi:hypothetical protein
MDLFGPQRRKDLSMSAQGVRFMVPPTVTAPRGARWVAYWAGRLSQRGDARTEPSPYQRQTATLLQAMGQSIWRAFEASGQRRAARGLKVIAQRWESIDPAAARQMHDAVRHLNKPSA